MLDDGRRIALDGLVLLGRNPQPKAGEEDKASWHRKRAETLRGA